MLLLKFRFCAIWWHKSGKNGTSPPTNSWNFFLVIRNIVMDQNRWENISIETYHIIPRQSKSFYFVPLSFGGTKVAKMALLDIFMNWDHVEYISHHQKHINRYLSYNSRPILKFRFLPLKWHKSGKNGTSEHFCILKPFAIDFSSSKTY